MSDPVTADIIWVECDVNILAVGIKVSALVPIGNAAHFSHCTVNLGIETDIYAVVVTLGAVGINCALCGCFIISSQLIRCS